MAYSIHQDINCPYCHHKQNFEIMQVIEPEKKESIIDGSFGWFTCEECGKSARLISSFLYHDKEQKLMIYLVTGESEMDKDYEKKNMLNIINKSPDIDDSREYTCRFAYEIDEVAEKIMIFEDRLNDRVIELLKPIYFTKAQEELEDTRVMSIRYDNTDEKPAFRLITDNDAIATMEFYRDIYDAVAEKYADVVNVAPTGNFESVNYDWAMSIINE